jgi:hypothetical protein
MIKLYEFMLKAEKKLLKDIEKAIPEYDELIDKANEIEIKKFVPNFNLKNLLIKAKNFFKLREDRKNETELEEAEINTSRLMNLTYDLSTQLNQIRYKVRKTPEEKARMQQIIKELEIIKRDINSLVGMIDQNNN